MADYKSGGDKALEVFADLMIKKIEEVANDWNQPWFTSRGVGMPENLSGRTYDGVNTMMLFLLAEMKDYTVPVYLTFNQAREQEVLVKKGEKSFPVVYWNFMVTGDDKSVKGEKISINQYNRLSDEQKEKYKLIPYLKKYNVFNVEQTTFPEKFPERWESLKNKFNAKELKDEKGMLCCPAIDTMLEKQNWFCPINVEISNRAYYAPKNDKITVPAKGQFVSGEAFYAVLLHEMAHSTGNSSRLNRNIKNAFGDPMYGKEELIAELTSAVCCKSLGITSGIQEENAQYLKSWLGALKKEPKFILSVLSDVNKASTMISDVVLKQEVSQEISTELSIKSRR